MGQTVTFVSLCVFLLVHSPDPCCSAEASHFQYGNKPEYFDLSYDLDEDAIFYPGQTFDKFELYRDTEGFNRTALGNYKFWFAKYSFCMSEHGGTHIDAPFHFAKHGWKVNEIPLDRLADIPTTVIDVAHLVFALQHPDEFVLDVHHILDHEAKYGRIPPGSLVIVRFGWDRYWPNKNRYLGMVNSTSGETTMNFPGLSGETAKWLMQERRIIGIGTDTANPETGANNTNGSLPVHLTLLPNFVYILENVAYLDELIRRTRRHSPFCNIHSFVLPIKTQGTGGPTRILAYCKQ